MFIAIYSNASIFCSIVVGDYALPEKISQRMCNVRFSCLTGPQSMFVHLKLDLDNLNEMQQALGRACVDKPLAKESAAVGVFVACVISSSHDGRNTDIWCRAVIKLKRIETLKVHKLTKQIMNNEWYFCLVFVSIVLYSFLCFTFFVSAFVAGLRNRSINDRLPLLRASRILPKYPVVCISSSP